MKLNICKQLEMQDRVRNIIEHLIVSSGLYDNVYGPGDVDVRAYGKTVAYDYIDRSLQFVFDPTGSVRIHSNEFNKGTSCGFLNLDDELLPQIKRNLNWLFKVTQ